MTKPPDNAVVVGAGVVGVSTAYALARRGLHVTIIDRNDSAAGSASFANGGQLSYLYTDALASNRILAHLPKLALGMDKSFRIRSRADPEFISWLMRFLANCTNERFTANTRATLNLALKSRASMLSLLERHDLEFGYAIRGKLHIFHDRTALAAAHIGHDAKCLSTSDQRFLTAQEALELEPALAQVNDVIAGAVYSPDEAVGDAHAFSRALLQTLISEYCVTARLGSEVQSIQLKGDQAAVTLQGGEKLETDLIVLCTGGTTNLFKAAKINLPICPMKGYSLTARPGPDAPQISITDTKRRIVFTRLGDAIRIAGFADLGWPDQKIVPERMEALICAARDAMPKAADYDNTACHWAGVRPMTPNSQPYIGRPRPALAYNVGHGMLGWTLAMGAADMIGELVQNNRTTLR